MTTLTGCFSSRAASAARMVSEWMPSLEPNPPPTNGVTIRIRSLSIRSVLAVVYPAAYIIGGALVVLVNAALLRGYLARRDPGWLDGGEFEGIHWPLGLAVLFVLTGPMVLWPPLQPAAYNLLLIEAFFFALQGLAVIAYFARRLAAPALLRGAVLLLILISPWAPHILAGVGLLDLWCNFRRFADPPAEEE